MTIAVTSDPDATGTASGTEAFHFLFCPHLNFYFLTDLAALVPQAEHGPSTHLQGAAVT